MSDPKHKSLATLKRQRTKRLAKVAARSYYLQRKGRKQEMYDFVCDEFLSLGGIYIKFLQGVLFNTEIVRMWQNPDKLKIFENVDREPMDIIAILHRELSLEQLQLIKGINTQPFAAGSFGQVYLGQHANGKRVIIKVLRPEVSKLVKFDLRLLGFFSKRFTAYQNDNIAIKMGDAFKEFRAATLDETNYIAEAKLASTLYKYYEDHPHIVIPETYLDLCTSNIIVQEYVGGISGAALLKVKEQGIDPVAYIKQQTGSNLDTQLCMLGVEYLTSTFNLPRIQGDPHPGNIRFLPDNKVGIIDFGVSASAPRNKAAFFGIIEQWDLIHNGSVDLSNLFEKYLRFFSNDLYRALKLLNGFIPQKATNSLYKTSESNGIDLIQVLCRVSQDMLSSAIGVDELQAIINEGRIMQTLGKTINRGNRMGLVMHIESSQILRAWQTYMAMIIALGCRERILSTVFTEAVEYLRSQHSGAINSAEKPMSVTRATDIINQWLERVATRDPALFRQLLGYINMNASVIPKDVTENA